MSQHVLTLREHESATIGSRWDPATRVIPPAAVARLERVQDLSGREAFLISRRAVKATQFVGTVALGDRAVDVLPKVDGADDPQTRGNLVRMLSVAGLVPEIDAEVAALGRRSMTLLDAFMLVYVRRLAAEWRRGRIGSYRRINMNRSSLRGKLLFASHIRLNLTRPDRFYTQADEFVEDVLLSRVLKAALQICRKHATAEEPRRAAVALLPEFEEVTDISASAADLATVATDRRTERFAAVLELSKLLLGSAVPDRPGQGITYSLLFDMNIVFERFIARLLNRVVCPPERSARPQIRGRSLLLRNGRPRFALRPDVGVYQRRRLTFLIDTKWKQLDPKKRHEGVTQADVYQAYAYGKEYGCSKTVLLYPHCDGLGQRVAQYRHPPGSDGCQTVDICTVDVRLPPTSRTSESVAGLLRRLLDSLETSVRPPAP